MSEKSKKQQRKITDNDSTMYIPNNSEEYRNSAHAYTRQNFGNHKYAQQHIQNQQASPTPPQPYYGQQQHYQEKSGYPQQPYQGAPPPYDGGQYQPQPQYQYPPHPQQKPPQKRKKKKKKKNPVKKMIIRLILILLILFIFIFGIYSCVSLSLITKFNYTETGVRSRNPDAMSEDHVESILVIGTDGRTVDDRGRSDSMILVSLNKKTNEIIMTSFLRDSYVNISGRGMDKLNAAYSYGGAELLMDTIENNFNVKIDNYILINFTSFASIIDAAGGVDITLSDEEAEAVNVILVSEVNGLMGDEPTADFLAGGGNVHLNGKQALCYSRIRNVGNNDFERTERQRTLMTKLIKKAASSGLSFINKAADEALPNITTNMTRAKLYQLSLRLPFVLTYKTKQLQIPAEGTYWGENVYAGAVLSMDYDANIDIIEDTVFAEK